MGGLGTCDICGRQLSHGWRQDDIFCPNEDKHPEAAPVKPKQEPQPTKAWWGPFNTKHTIVPWTNLCPSSSKPVSHYPAWKHTVNGVKYYFCTWCHQMMVQP